MRLWLQLIACFHSCTFDLVIFKLITCKNLLTVVAYNFKSLGTHNVWAIIKTELWNTFSFIFYRRLVYFHGKNTYTFVLKISLYLKIIKKIHTFQPYMKYWWYICIVLCSSWRWTWSSLSKSSLKLCGNFFTFCFCDRRTEEAIESAEKFSVVNFDSNSNACFESKNVHLGVWKILAAVL